MQKQDPVHQLTAHLFREDSGKMVAFLSARYGLDQLDLVMDVVQDTFEAALSKWRFSGIPDNPSAWLMQVAKNKAINAIKRDAKSTGLSVVDLSLPENGQSVDFLLSEQEIKDSQLKLLFLCCHPEFSSKNQIIITLHILCGFGMPEIANALLMSDEAVKKALHRCKSFLRESGDLLNSEYLSLANRQTHIVQTIIYLIFNEGYKTTRSKEAINHDLCYEAIRLAKLLTNDHREEQQHETEALLALMFFNLSRFAARVNTSGEWLTLEEQDRSKWNKVFIEEGYYYLDRATRSNQLSRFHLEAIISSIHCAAPTFEETNWQQIVALYVQLELLTPTSPFITLNKIIAESYIRQASDSIRSIEQLANDPQLKNHFLIPAAKGDIYQRNGQFREAIAAYVEAMELAVAARDNALLRKKITRCHLKSIKT